MPEKILEQEILHLKQELKAQDRQIHTLELRSNNLENNYNHQHDQLEEIKDILKDLQKTINENNGASAVKVKLHNNIYMWLTFLVLLFCNDYFWTFWKK